MRGRTVGGELVAATTLVGAAPDGLQPKKERKRRGREGKA